jgi:hypothetical protein
MLHPGGCISSAAISLLEYAIGFENTGNDTAHNIFIMDTLSASLDISSLKIVTASAFMNLSKIKYGAQTILKIDFPGINLLDSTHHNHCNGVVMFDIKTLSGLPDNRHIDNRAGIYFDINEVVMTNSVTNIVNCPLAVQPTAVPGNKFTVYPNPANDELLINTDASPYNSFTITNQLGQVLLQGTLTANHTRVDIKALPAGLYFISATGENVIGRMKFVKE